MEQQILAVVAVALEILHQQPHAKAIMAALVRLALLTMVLVAGVGPEALDLQGQQLLVRTVAPEQPQLFLVLVLRMLAVVVAEHLT
jgi:hypothetical protein